MTSIADNLQAVHARIAAACAAAGRRRDSVTLLAVSKTWPSEAIREAAKGGARAFGESYVQEAIGKIAALADLDLEWHFIGPLQSNKTRLVAEHFAWVHSIDRLKIAERLSAQRPAGLPPLQVCIEVNVSGEASKSGCAPDDAVELARHLVQLPNLVLRGLMTIPEASEDVALVRQRFAELGRLRERVGAACGLALDTLSMGMSHDLEVAIAEGATIVRVGTAIFGSRAPH
jgi:pyridoxal phosphate enzyme (YggS family)